MENSGWDVHKSEIERLYICENKTREEVRTFMATKYSWKKSLAQYSRMFNKWRFRKHSDPRDDQFIAWKVGKRKREGKESEVFIKGIQIHPSKITKSSYRKGFLAEHSRYKSAPSTPEGYAVATPAPPDVSPSSPGFRALNLSRNGNAVATSINFKLMQQLSTIVPWKKLQHSPNMYSSSRTSAALSILMPEHEPGQHEALSADLSTSKAGSWELMSVVLFLLSNNLTLQAPKDPFRGIERDDKLVLQILRDTGWDDLKHLKMLTSSPEPSAQYIMEKVFAAALRQDNFFLFQKLLQSGMSPHGLIENSIDEKTFLTPLQYISKKWGSPLYINLLINHGVDVNFSVKNDGKTALWYAFCTMTVPAIHALLDHEATITMDCAELVVSKLSRSSYFYQEYPLLEGIIDIYLDQDLTRQRDETKILEAAVLNNNLSLVQRFVSKGAHLNGRLHFIFSGSEYQTTLLGLAVKNENIQMVQLLLHVSAYEDSSVGCSPFISPLALAAENGLVDICQLLLNSGADIRNADEGQKTLLERVVPKNNLALCQLLINHGARVDRDPCEIQHSPSALMIAVQRRFWDIVDLLIGLNARLNDVFDVGAGTILAEALQIGDEELINKLVEVGATMIGTMEVFQNFCISLAPALLERGARVTDFDLTEAMNNKFDFLQMLLDNFTGSAPTAVSTAVLKSSMTHLKLLRKADISFLGRPQMPPIGWSSRHVPRWYFQAYRLQSVLEIATSQAEYFIFKYLLEWESSSRINWGSDSVARSLTIAIFQQTHDRIVDLMRLDSDLDCSNCSITIDTRSFPYFDWASKASGTYTPLQAAVKTQQVPIVHDLLFLKGADVNYLGEGALRRTPLQHAVELGNMEIFDLLIERDADVNAPPADNGGATALQIAAIQGFIGIARRLIDLGADIHQAAACKNGRTALMGAAEYGRIDMLQLLLHEGALVPGGFKYELEFSEAIDLAESRGHYAAARLLTSFKDSAEWGSVEHMLDNMSD
ncbi:ankyrin [Penicillium malachiteum]|uniref:Ankyrin n=1 Tax=Penicillium malachiteum TaxID=1324776 RepID=A0AAD6MYE5_9EURO|nr:ankyrin [Penicillium malachiteum]